MATATTTNGAAIIIGPRIATTTAVIATAAKRVTIASIVGDRNEYWTSSPAELTPPHPILEYNPQTLLPSLATNHTKRTSFI
jgi:hypothetical protein